MAIEESKQVVLDWIQSGCNYQQGTMLYSQFGKNNFLKKGLPWQAVQTCYQNHLRTMQVGWFGLRTTAAEKTNSGNCGRDSD